MRSCIKGHSVRRVEKHCFRMCTKLYLGFHGAVNLESSRLVLIIFACHWVSSRVSYPKEDLTICYINDCQLEVLMLHGQSIIEHISIISPNIYFTLSSTKIKFHNTTSMMLFFLFFYRKRNKGKVPIVGSLNLTLLHRWLQDTGFLCFHSRFQEFTSPLTHWFFCFFSSLFLTGFKMEPITMT